MQNLLGVLKKYWNYDSFLTPQQEIIQSILNGKDTLALLPTGGGKSLCYQLPILSQEGLCLVVSPLLALMKDQVKSLNQKGIKAELISSELTTSDISIVMDNCLYGGVKLLYISPERLKSPYFREKIKQLNVAYVAIDEAHCIAEWGHDFRPSYLELIELRKLLPNIPFLALTASATESIQKEIKEKLGFTSEVTFSKSLERKNLTYNIIESQDKWVDLLYYLKKYSGSTIVFCRSRKDTYEISRFLQRNGMDADYFHAKLSVEEKNKKQNYWINSDKAILVSTNAFGMGIDKPNVRLVVHMHVPQTVEGYFQEVGRAGRDGKAAKGILLFEKDDCKTNEKIFKNGIPSKSQYLNITKKLYNYFQITEGEQPLKQFAFSLQKFVDLYNLPLIKTKFVLQFLTQQQVIAVHQTEKQSLVKILVSNYEIEDKKDKKNLVLSFLARNYGGIFTNYTPINEYFIRQRLNLSKIQLKNILNELSKEEQIYYRDASIRQISFELPRDDRAIEFSLWKKLIDTQSYKWKRLQDMHYYVLNEQYCRSQLLLRYFGEKKKGKCGTCDNCKVPNSNEKIGSSDLLHFLKTGKKSLDQITQEFIHSPKEDIALLLQELLEEEKIKNPQPNYFTL